VFLFYHPVDPDNFVENRKRNLFGANKQRQKDCGPTILVGLITAVHSGTLSHYCLPRELLAAGFHPWPGSSLLSQPECHGLLHGTHIDGELSADVPSTWAGPLHSRSQPQAIPQSDLTEA